MTNELEYYLSLEYPCELVRDAVGGTYFAHHPDLPGCAAQGDNANEAVVNLDAARRLWIETRLQDSLSIPEPVEDEPSGRVSLRMATSLHAELNRIAGRKGVSLNLLLNTILAAYVGRFDYREDLRACREELLELRDALAASGTPTRGRAS
jgi:predicted RNase H-like HicB family nuclease